MKHFASVHIACAGFEASICLHVLKTWFADEITLQERLVGSTTLRANPRVVIRYFTQSHAGSTSFWEKSEGRYCLNQICRYFDKHGPVGFWSGNQVVRDYMEHWVKGQMETPKLAGTNSLIEHTVLCPVLFQQGTVR
jgi:hypothetical protein